MNPAATCFALKARYVFPVQTPPLPDGVITIDDGRITAVGENLSSGPPRDLGNVAVLPGLVNAHTHLEFSDLTSPLGDSCQPFPDWIHRVVEYRRARRDDPGATAEQAILHGLAESTAAGTTLLGDIATTAWPRTCEDIDGTVFREFLGLDTEPAALIESATEHLENGESSNWHPGVSPHAPYTVPPDLIRKLVEFSASHGVPLAIHLAESMEELELLRSHCGPLLELLEELEAWDPTAVPRGIEPLDYLQMLSAADRCLIVHGNYLTSTEINFAAAHADRMSVVYCPRSHAFFGHGKYPLAEMFTAGVNVALGTDSRASVADLSVLAELRQVARQHPEVSAAEILKLATINGAKALGRHDATGSLAPGKHANLVVVSLPDAEADDPYQLVLDSELPIQAVVYRGAVVTATKVV